MASKRLSRGFRPSDKEMTLGAYDKRDGVLERRRLLLAVATVVVLLTGACIGIRAGGRMQGRALASVHSFQGTHLESEKLLVEHSDTDAFPSSSKHASTVSSIPTDSNQHVKAGWPAKAAQATSAKSFNKPSTQQDQGHISQQHHLHEAASGDAASKAANTSNWTGAYEASKAANGSNWAGAFKVQLAAASDRFASGLQSAASNVTATIAAKASDLRAKDQFASKLPAVPSQTANQNGTVGIYAFPWSVQMVEKTLCNDTCHKAKDGKCDDGSTGEEKQVFCDLGTDCSDCGPWTFKVPSQQPNQSQPIKLLHGRKIDVFVKNTTSVPSFLMAYTDPTKDVDVSGQMEYGGVVEVGLTMMWYKALKDKCIQRGKGRGLVLDVGGNFGWYSIYAASLGCRVISWEPVPHFRAFLEYNRQLNHLEDLIEIRDTAVVEVGGVTYDLTVPQRGIWGTAGIGGLNIDRGVDNQGGYEMVKAVGERIDEVVHQDVVLLKVDVEGHEPGVIKSAKGLLANHKVDHIVMEYSPGPWEINYQWKEYIDLSKMLMYLLERNYTIMHVHDGYARSPLLQLPGWTGDIGALEEVMMDHMQHDLADARLLQTQELGCPKPKELTPMGGQWSGCNAIPEDLHPKSFRAAFGHNTNVWTMRDRTAFKATLFFLFVVSCFTGCLSLLPRLYDSCFARRSPALRVFPLICPVKCILAALGPALIPDLGPALIPDLGPAMIPAQIPVLSPAPNTALALVLHPFLFLALGCSENDLHSALGLVPVPGPGCAGGSTPALHPALTPAPVLGYGPNWLCPCLGPPCALCLVPALTLNPTL